MILAGDIGGTKTLLALYSEQECVRKQLFLSHDYPSFYQLLTAFLDSANKPLLSAVCLGVAGPIVNGDCLTTNLPWSLERAEIAAIANCSRVRLLNDLEATAWGVINLENTEFIELNSQAKTQTGNIAIIAAGTGLGEAIISRNENGDHVIATEGGHTDFAPTDDLEIELLRYLTAKYAGHVSYERVVSGMGIQNIFEFLRDDGRYSISEKAALAIENNNDAGAVISQLAQSGEDELCAQTMDLFVRIYGAEAGNLALKTLAFGGVVLAGGIGPKNLSLLQRGEFMRKFVAKGRYQPVLQDISVKICMNAEAALLGAVHYAQVMQEAACE